MMTDCAIEEGQNMGGGTRRRVCQIHCKILQGGQRKKGKKTAWPQGK